MTTTPHYLRYIEAPDNWIVNRADTSLLEAYLGAALRHFKRPITSNDWSTILRHRLLENANIRNIPSVVAKETPQIVYEGSELPDEWDTPHYQKVAVMELTTNSLGTTFAAFYPSLELLAATYNISVYYLRQLLWHIREPRPELTNKQFVVMGNLSPLSEDEKHFPRQMLLLDRDNRVVHATSSRAQMAIDTGITERTLRRLIETRASRNGLWVWDTRYGPPVSATGTVVERWTNPNPNNPIPQLTIAAIE